MKKLLIGALLVVTGAMVFGEQRFEIPQGQNSATGSLRVESRGEVIDLGCKTYLVIKPTMSAGADGTSLVFDHGQIAKGKQSTPLVGKYEAKVIQYGATSAEDKVLQGTFNSNLKAMNGTEITNNTGRFAVNATGTTTKIGDISYKLDARKDEQTYVHKGSIVSLFDATEAQGTGSFIDRSVDIEVTVANVALNGGAL